MNQSSTVFSEVDTVEEKSEGWMSEKNISRGKITDSEAVRHNIW